MLSSNILFKISGELFVRAKIIYTPIISGNIDIVLIRENNFLHVWFIYILYCIKILLSDNYYSNKLNFTRYNEINLY